MRQLVPRKYERKRVVGPVVVRPLGGAPLPGTAIDLGQSGMSVFAIRGLTKGQAVEVSFKVEDQAVPPDVAKRDGRVVRCRSLPDGNVLGIAFSRPFEAEELKLLEAHWVRI